jgi:hypothetical protein
MPTRAPIGRLCTVAGCGRQHEAKDLCHSHLAWWRRTGVWPTEPFRPAPTVSERFFAKVNKDAAGGHWLWTGSTASEGRYGSFQYEGHVHPAHRVSLWLAGVDFPNEWDVDHLCRVTLCVRRDHLEPVPHVVNVLRGESIQAKNAAKTHCKRNHEFDEENTYLMPGGGRYCRACARATGAERQREHRAQLPPMTAEQRAQANAKRRAEYAARKLTA